MTMQSRLEGFQTRLPRFRYLASSHVILVAKLVLVAELGQFFLGQWKQQLVGRALARMGRFAHLWWQWWRW